MGKRPGRASPEAAGATERQKQAMELRIKGKSFDTIAEIMGYASKSGAFKAVMAGIRKTLQEPADRLRKIEIERLDRMLDVIWVKIETCDDVMLDKMLSRALDVMKRRSMYLGLDAPTKIAPTNPKGDKPYGGDLTNDERVERLTALLELAREKRDRRVDASPGPSGVRDRSPGVPT